MKGIETQEKKIKKEKINKNGFFLVIGLLTSILIVSIILQIVYYSRYSFDKTISDALGIASQIITAIIVCILQILGITFSIQTNEWYGLKLYELREMRKDRHFSFSATAAISISLLIANIICFFSNFLILCFGICLCTILFGVYVFCMEMPLLTLKQKVIFKIIKDQIIANYAPKDLLQPKYHDALRALIYEKNIPTVYNWLKSEKDSDFNEKLMLKLLDIQETEAFRLETISDKRVLLRTVENYYGTIRNILDGSFNVIPILGKDSQNYQHYFTRVLFRLIECQYSKMIIERLCRDIVWAYISIKDSDKEQRKLFVNVMVAIITISVKNNDFRVIEELKKQYSLHYFGLTRETATISTSIFAIISFFLFYLAELEQETSDELRKRVIDFINTEGIVDNTQIISWKNLFLEFSRSFSIDYADFIEIYRDNEYNIEQMVTSPFAHNVVLNEETANDWYLANLLNKDNCYHDDYSQLLDDLTGGHINYYFESFIKNNFRDREFSPSDKLLKVIKFYSDNNNPFYSFSDNENDNHKLYAYYEGLKKEEFEIIAKKNAEISNESLEKKYKPLIENSFTKEWQYDSQIDLSGQKQKYISFIYERASNAINHDECLINILTESVYRDIRKNLDDLQCTFDNLNELIKRVLEDDIVAATDNSQFIIYRIKDKELRENYSDKIQKLEKINSKILIGYYFIAKDGYKVRIKIDDFTATDLNEKLLNNEIERYKRSDGQYVYDGVFMQRKDVENFIRNKFVVYTLIFTYRILSTNQSILSVPRKALRDGID